MIKELSDALRQLINSLSSRPIESMFAVLLIIAIYIGYRSYDAIETMIITPAEEAARFEKQLESSDLVNRAIDNLRVELNADNITIKQFHNGRHDLTGIPFTEASSIFITSRSGDTITATKDEPVPTMNRSLRMVWQRIDRPQCTVLYAPVDISTRQYFYTYKSNRVVICPLVNLLNYPIGIIVVGFSEGDIDDKIVVARTAAISKRVTGYLNDY